MERKRESGRGIKRDKNGRWESERERERFECERKRVGPLKQS